MTLPISAWMRDEQERRKDLWRRLWAGQAVERIPIQVQVIAPSPYTVREQFQDGDKQLEVALASALATWEMAPSSDAIPAMRPDVGCSCLASAFGSQYYWGDSPAQTPGIRQPIITDLERQVDSIAVPDPSNGRLAARGAAAHPPLRRGGRGVHPGLAPRRGGRAERGRRPDGRHRDAGGALHRPGGDTPPVGQGAGPLRRHHPRGDRRGGGPGEHHHRRLSRPVVPRRDEGACQRRPERQLWAGHVRRVRRALPCAHPARVWPRRAAQLRPQPLPRRLCGARGLAAQPGPLGYLQPRGPASVQALTQEKGLHLLELGSCQGGRAGPLCLVPRDHGGHGPGCHRRALAAAQAGGAARAECASACGPSPRSMRGVWIGGGPRCASAYTARPARRWPRCTTGRRRTWGARWPRGDTRWSTAAAMWG